MRKFFLIAFIAIYSSLVFAQTQVPENSTSPIYYQDQSVLIGKDGAEATSLLVTGTSNATFQMKNYYQNVRQLFQIGLACNNGAFAKYAKPGDVVFRKLGYNLEADEPYHNMLFEMPNDNNDGSSYITFGDFKNGRTLSIFNNSTVSIGTTSFNSHSKLYVNGNIAVARNNKIGKGINTGEYYGIRFHQDGINAFTGGSELPYNHGMTIDSDAIISFVESDANHIHGWMNLNDASFVWNGNVKVKNCVVKTKLEASEIKVTTVAGADFVFEDNYHLKDLSEVEAFIKTNKHLPEIPSAAEMEEAGVNLAEMNKLLLMKVEELTLYVIEKDKEVESLELKVEELTEDQRRETEEMNDELNKQNERLAKMESLLEELTKQ
jgi:hypothetical protein